MKQEINTGDTVAYSAEFLRSIADYSHASASKRFKVETLENIAKGFTIAHMTTKDGEKTSANVLNLARVSSSGVVIE